MLLADKIKLLIKESGLNVRELARQTNLPQSTLQKIITGESQNPRPSTLKKIADFFNIKVRDLTLTEEEIFIVNKNSQVPLISWSNIPNWLTNKAIKPNVFLPTKRKVSSKSFAVVSNDIVIPQFKNSGAVLVFDPEIPANDGSIILVQLNDYEGVLLRQLMVDVKEKFIKSLNPELSTRLSPLGEKDTILATLIQIIIDYETN